MKWRSSLLLIRMEWSIRLSDELNRKHMEWAILCVFGFSFWGTELMCFQIFSFWGIELMCFQILSFWVDRTYAFPDIIFLGDRTYVIPDIFLKGTICVFTEMDWT